MVMYAVVAVLLPLAMAGTMQMGNQQMGWGGNSGWGSNSGWGGNSGWGVQMQGVISQGNMQQGGQMMQQGGQMMQQGGQMMQQGGQNQQYWDMQTQEEYAAYIKWCEERKMAIQEQEAQKELLEEIEERAEGKKREMEREHAMKEMKMKRESMMMQWKQWQQQLAAAEEFDGSMNKYEEMKVKYMFSLTMDFLKFCKCSDYTGALQKYLMYGEMSFEPGMNDAYSLDDLVALDTTDVEAAAQQLARLSQVEQTEQYFGGIIATMCGSVKTYIDQVKVWEQQYNFMGI